ncbi:MAG: hypothetical protein OXI86_05690 [Candidatus Poribacteria bacterium]|nr:hypothetical protein [Candidatus Poribacteria bacterium]
MGAISCGTQAMYDYLDATRERREALAVNVNAWFKKIDLRVVEALIAGTDPEIVIDGLRGEIGQPINPFLSAETLSAERGEDFMERVADDLYFGERALGMSLDRFRSHVSRYLENRIRYFLEPREPDHIETIREPDGIEIIREPDRVEIIDDTTPDPQSSEWPDALAGLFDVTQGGAEDRLKQVEEEFELKKPTMSQSEIEEFEVQLHIAKEALRYMKEQTEEFKRLGEDE